MMYYCSFVQLSSKLLLIVLCAYKYTRWSDSMKILKWERIIRNMKIWKKNKQKKKYIFAIASYVCCQFFEKHWAWKYFFARNLPSLTGVFYLNPQPFLPYWLHHRVLYSDEQSCLKIMNVFSSIRWGIWIRIAVEACKLGKCIENQNKQHG